MYLMRPWNKNNENVCILVIYTNINVDKLVISKNLFKGLRSLKFFTGFKSVFYIPRMKSSTC